MIIDYLSGLANFNSHAHVERDEITGYDFDDGKISTHTLTWSVTLTIVSSPGLRTHFNSHAHVERDLLNHIDRFC